MTGPAEKIAAADLRRYAEKMDDHADVYGEDRGEPFREAAEAVRDIADGVDGGEQA